MEFRAKKKQDITEKGSKKDYLSLLLFVATQGKRESFVRLQHHRIWSHGEISCPPSLPSALVNIRVTVRIVERFARERSLSLSINYRARESQFRSPQPAGESLGERTLFDEVVQWCTERWYKVEKRKREWKTKFYREFAKKNVPEI